jgi:hypothetical protein
LIDADNDLIICWPISDIRADDRCAGKEVDRRRCGGRMIFLVSDAYRIPTNKTFTYITYYTYKTFTKNLHLQKTFTYNQQKPSLTTLTKPSLIKTFTSKILHLQKPSLITKRNLKHSLAFFFANA